MMSSKKAKVKIINWITRLFLLYIISLGTSASERQIDPNEWESIKSDQSGMKRNIEPDEWPLVPIWCRYTQATGEAPHNPSNQARILIAQMGLRGWKIIHHYCWGLVKIHRSHKIGLTPQERDSYLVQAVSEIDFVLQNAPRDFIMRPELLTKRGSILLTRRRYYDAEKNLLTAIKENKNYWPPYGYLADLYLEQGEIEKAKSILTIGLKISPSAKGLKQRMASLEKRSIKKKDTFPAE